MSPQRYGSENLLYWASDIEEGTLEQAARTSRLPFLAGPLALMPDAHLGFGSTVGSVIATRGAIIPGAVGVDIGCGMVAVLTDYCDSDLPGLDALMPLVTERIPAGVGKAHDEAGEDVFELLGLPHTELTGKQATTARNQHATLGSGNHFAEVSVDELHRVWLVLHSGSRGIGNQLATQHIDRAKGLMKERFITLEDPDLAYLVASDPEFSVYIQDMLWAQEYARTSRDGMAGAFLKSLVEIVGLKDGWAGYRDAELDRINCHHNYTQQEIHGGRPAWITRKGAIKADVADRGIIPGSMGTDSFIVAGLGNPAAYNSSSHGAGRRMSRGDARRQLDTEGLIRAMEGRTWNQAPEALIDEDPRAYKDIHAVMEDQADLARIEHQLRSVFNYKGTNDGHRRKKRQPEDAHA